jgi:hypothetical protein
VADGVLSRKVVELKACGPDDPDGSSAAEVLNAYFQAEHALAFRRLLWPQLAIVAVAWGLVATLFLSGSVLIGGLLVIVAAAGYAAALEWRTSRRLKELIAGQRARRGQHGAVGTDDDL